MTSHARVSLEQWSSLLSVVDTGGYAQAALALHKSQSAITYAVQKMETLLGVKIFEVIGRKAHLTPTGEVLYRRAKALVEEAGALERAAGSLAAGWEPELRLAVEVIFPTWLLLQCFARFAEEQPQIRIELYETVISGTEEALVQRKVDLAICSQVPPGFAGDALMQIRTVSNKATSIHAAAMGLGFAWFPEDTVRAELARGVLKPLPLREGGERWGDLYLVFADRDYAGPGALRLAQIIRERVGEQCRRLEHE